jgi:hypothetical protein
MNLIDLAWTIVIYIAVQISHLPPKIWNYFRSMGIKFFYYAPFSVLGVILLLHGIKEYVVYAYGIDMAICYAMQIPYVAQYFFTQS